MASIYPNRKNGKITSFKFKAYLGRDENGKQVLVTADKFEGKTIDVKGFVDYFDGDYQVEIYLMDHVTFH